MTRRIFITIEYDGTPFVGWQRQVTGLSVQQVLEEAAAELTGGDILVQGAGRTDSGVHATGQVAHLDVPDKFDANRVMEALNALTGDHPVSIIEAREVDSEAHARFSATGRRYLYRLLPRRQPPALDHGRVWHHRSALDLGAMQAALQDAGMACVGNLVHEPIPGTLVECGEDDLEKNLLVLDKLAEVDDVDTVEHNILFAAD